MTIPSSFSTQSLRILHVEDDEDDYVIMRDLLQDIPNLSAEIDWVADYEGALSKLMRNDHDVCLLDYFLGKKNGLDLYIESRELGSTVPCVMLTGTGNREVDLQAMESGISFYLDKSNLNAFDLERAIRYSMQHARLLKQLQRFNEELEERVLIRTQLLVDAKELLEAEIKERERVERELRELRLERERLTFEQISRHPRTKVTAQLLGVRSLSETEPDQFDQMVKQYSGLLELAMEQLVYKVAHDISDELRRLADQMGEMRLSPRDVVEIHNAALRRRSSEVTVQKATSYVDEGRLMILEVMGYLTTYYRNLSSSPGRKVSREY